jgi:two-component system sensor histidine kinase/response regulator
MAALEQIRGAQLLVAEDNEINQQIVRELLESAGASVVAAKNGEEAVALATARAFDAILMDVQMPVMDGRDATRRIRQAARTLPIIAVTANAGPDEARKCLEAGMNDYVQKPIDPEKLFAALARWISPRGPAPPSSPRTATESVAVPDRLPGIDVKAGLARVAGNVSIYRRLLVDFRSDFRNAAGDLRRLLAEGQLEEAGRRVHNLRGVAGNLGAASLHRVATAIETAIRNGSTGEATSLHAQLEQSLADVINGLDTLGEPSIVPRAHDVTATSGTRGRILIVDDTPASLTMLSAILNGAGYDARPVAESTRAIETAESELPDLVLLSVSMPDLNGYQVCERLKGSSVLREIPVIFLTSRDDTADIVRAFDAGGVDYITKPFHADEVLARVHAHLSLRRVQLQLAENYNRLQSLERLRDDLVHMVVHDMRSPLTVIMGHLEYLQRDSLPDSVNAKVATELQSAIRAASEVNQMSNDLLDVSRLEDGKLPLDRQSHDLVHLAAGVREFLSSTNRTRTVRLEESSPVNALVDEALIRRVLENLVNNALEQPANDGTARIAISRIGQRVRVEVRDAGATLAPDVRQRLFDKFGTMAARRQSGFRSTGLGLAFCKLAIEAHGGTIGVEPGSRSGNTFWFELPIE